MKIYIVRQPFMSKESQFEKDKHTLCVGIEVNSLRYEKWYRVYIGKNRKDFYDITYEEALEVFKKYKEKCIWKKGNQRVFILPLNHFRHGKSKYSEEEYQKKENERVKKNLEVQDRLF